MTYKVSFSSENNYSVKTNKTTSYKASITYEMPQNLSELADVQISGNRDKYVLMYDSASGKWIDANPDAVLDAAATEPTSPGISTTFTTSIGSQVNLDAGTF